MPTLTRSRSSATTAVSATESSTAGFRGSLLQRWRGSGTGRSRGLSMPRVRLMVVGVWLLVLLWPLAAVRVFAPHATTVAGPGPVAVFPRAVDARAAQFLRVWLTAGEGTERTLAGYLPTPLPVLDGIRPGSLTADWVTSYSVTHTGGTQDYAVLLMAGITAHPAPNTAAVTTPAAAPASTPPSSTQLATQPATRCYQVVLTAVGRGYNPTQPPAQTACPVSGVPAAESTSSLPVTGSAGSVQDTVTRWLDAYLVGDGDITRYTTPGVRLPAISPPPATKLTLTALDLATGDTPAATNPTSGSRIHVLATVTAGDSAAGDSAAGVTSQLTYPLTLTARAGRWEVSAIDITTHPTR